ncbi:hypothetical protein WA026_013674 [Henosepilachna vigintioctopunctata]|uniref:C2H2-type domain-containing protein n=1 Tax=Henosepilachna vigintioctopunctata TaxID=420089 RepID=A0AAW1UTJ9_9CUCU
MSAGPSHGNMGERSGQGFIAWHLSNQSQDEVFLAAQEAVGAHRDSQELDFKIGNDGRYNCHKCKASYKNKKRVIRHLIYKCGVEPKFKCENCLQKFEHNYHLKQHTF